MRATSYLSYFSAGVLRLVRYYGETLRAKEKRDKVTERTTEIRIAARENKRLDEEERM